jgi:translocation and assembly module TamA
MVKQFVRYSLNTAALMAVCVSSSVWSATLNVVVEGVEGELKENVEGFLSIEALNGEEIKSLSRVRYLHRQAEDDIRSALEPFGYYEPSIETSLEEKGDQWVATYRVTAGTPVTYSTVDLAIDGAANDDPEFQRLMNTSEIRVGQVVLHSQYDTFKSRLMSLAAERGYHEAQVAKSQVRVDLESYSASADLKFESGPRYRIGEIHFSDSPLSEKLLYRYLPFEEGEPVRTSQLVDVQTALLDSDYFKRVEVRPAWENATDQEVPIDIQLEPQKRTRYEAGLGYGTDTGARMKLGVTRRWVNSLGHQMSGDLQLSEITNLAALEYTIPGKDPLKERYAINLNYEDENSDTVESETFGIGVSRQRQLREWQLVTALQYEEETYTLDGETTSSTLLYPMFSMSTVSAENRLNVKNGYRLTAQIKGGSDALLSDTNFVQLYGNAKWIHSLTDQTRVLARVEAGLTAAGDFDKIPASHRFYAGGDSSVRGYAYQSLGPKGDDGDVIGGPNLLVASLEADYRFTGSDWGVAAFIDAGNAYEDASINLKTGVGVGVRWFSPIGPVRLDLAVPQADDADDSFRIHFTLGADL